MWPLVCVYSCVRWVLEMRGHFGNMFFVLSWILARNDTKYWMETKRDQALWAAQKSMWIFITVTVFSMRIIITGSMHAKRPLIWNQIWAKHLCKKFKMNLHIRKRYGIMPSVWGSTDKNDMNLWSNIHPNSTNEDLLSVSESRDHTGILKPDDARDCFKNTQSYWSAH